jgi:hypothetical protein
MHFAKSSLLATAALLIGACGSSTATSSETSTADTATGATADATGDTAGTADTLAVDTAGGDAAAASALTVACPFGIQLVQHPVKNPLSPDQSEGAFAGIVNVRRKSGDVATAKVTVNGVELTYTNNGDYVVPNTADIPGAVAGAKLKLEVKDGSDSATFEFTCPTEVAFTAPAADTAVEKGQAVPVSWTGVLDYQHPLLKPGLGLYRLHAASGTFLGYSPMDLPKLAPSDTGVTLTMPDNDKPQYVVQLQVPGTFVATAKYDGIHCSLVRRLILTNKGVQ